MDDPILSIDAHAAGKRARLLLRLRSEMHELRPHIFCACAALQRPTAGGTGHNNHQETT
jgi:hypothetical protein